MELKVDLTSLELFAATNRERSIKEQIAKLIEEAIDKAGQKDLIGSLLMDLDRNNKKNRILYFTLAEK